MGGDGSAGLPLAILLLMVLVVAAGFGLSVWLGAVWARRRGGAAPASRRAGLIAGVGGLALGGAAVVSLFAESMWAPPPRLELWVPPGYAHAWTVLLEDPRATASLAWQGTGLPFSQRQARLEVPASGVARVRSLGEAAGRGDLEMVWSDGVPANGIGGGVGPAGTGANAYLLLGRSSADGSLPEAPSGAGLAAEIGSRETR